MSQDVAPWLAEIKALKQQIADLQEQLHQAYQSTDNWQKRYEVEARQRRLEMQQAQQTEAALQQEIQRLQGTLPLGDEDPAGAIAATIDPAETVEDLRRRLVVVLAERDRLAAALDQEQENHTATRQNLTTALGDAINLLAKEQAISHPHPNPES